MPTYLNGKLVPDGTQFRISVWYGDEYIENKSRKKLFQAYRAYHEKVGYQKYPEWWKAEYTQEILTGQAFGL